MLKLSQIKKSVKSCAKFIMQYHYGFLILLGWNVLLLSYLVSYLVASKQENLSTHQQLQEQIAVMHQEINDLIQKQKSFQQKIVVPVNQLSRLQVLIAQANDDLLLNYSSTKAIVLLERAQNIIKNSDTKDLPELQQALASDLDVLHHLTWPNFNNVYLQLLDVRQALMNLSYSSIEESGLEAVKPHQDYTTWRDWLQSNFTKLVQIYHVNNAQSVINTQIFAKSLILEQIGLLNQAIMALFYADQSTYKSNLMQIKHWLTTTYQENNLLAKNTLVILENLLAVDLQPTAPIKLKSLSVINLLLRSPA